MNSSLTPQQMRAYIDACEAIAAIIKHHTEHDPLEGIPSGHLYARLMGSMSFDMYRGMIESLINAGIIRQSPNYLLTYIRADQPFPENDADIAAAKRIAARIAARKEMEDDEERDARLGHP